MQKKQIEVLRRKLIEERRNIFNQLSKQETVSYDDVKGDEIDEANALTQAAMSVRMAERERRYLEKLQAALMRIRDGEYGDCAECGEEIGIKRLEIRPVTTLCVECKEVQERSEGEFARF